MSHVLHVNAADHTDEKSPQRQRRNVSRHTCECVVSHTGMCGVTRVNVWCHTQECVVSHV